MIIIIFIEGKSKAHNKLTIRPRRRKARKSNKKYEMDLWLYILYFVKNV